MSTQDVKEVVREKYGEAARRVQSGAGKACCGDRSALEASCDPITSNLYECGPARRSARRSLPKFSGLRQRHGPG
jgi:hypothetical protein